MWICQILRFSYSRLQLALREEIGAASSRGIVAVFVFLFCLVGQSLIAQDGVEAEAVENVPEQGLNLEGALQRLQALGWKSVKDSTWGRFESRKYLNDSGLNPYGYGQEISLKGNAWLRTSKESKRVVYAGGFREYFPSTSAKKKGFLKRLFKGGNDEAFQWSEKPLEADLKALHSWLEAGKQSDEFQWQYARKASEAMALVLALQLYESGREEEGKKLADAVMEVTLNGEMLIDEMVGSLAETRLEDLTSEFCKNDESRENYLRDLKKLESDFPRGWDGLLGVNRLVGFLETAEPNAIGLKVPKGVVLDSEVITLLEELAGPGSGIGRLPDVEWIWGGKVSGKLGAPFEALCEKGMDGFLGLAVTLSDNTLTRRRLSGGGEYDDIARLTRRFNSSFNDDGPDLEEIWSQMARPAMRSEFAMKLLIPILPGESSEYSELDEAGLQIEAMSFWKKHRASTPAQIAASYLEGGTAAQVKAAVDFLLESGEIEALAVFEQKVLAQPDLELWSAAVKAYLRKGRGETREFWKELRPKWEEQLEGLDESDFYQLGISSGNGQSFLRLLDRYAGGQSLAKMFRSMSQREDIAGLSEEFNALFESLQELPEEKRAKTLLEAMQPTDSKTYLIFMLSYLNYTALDVDELLEGRKEFWTALMLLREELPEELASGGGLPHVAGFAAYLLEAAAEGQEEVYSKAAVMGEGFYPFCLTRAEKRLAEEEIPAWPDSAQVDEARREAMLVEVESAPVAEKNVLIESWNYDEKIFWAEKRAEWEEAQEWPSWFTKLIPVILESKISEKEQAQLGSLALGKEITGDWLQELITTWPTEQPELDGLALNILPSQGGMGLSVTLAAVDTREGQWMGRYLDTFEESLGESKFIHVVWFAGESQYQTILLDGVFPEEDENWSGTLSSLQRFVATAKEELEEDEEPVNRASLYLARVTQESLAKMREAIESEDEE